MASPESKIEQTPHAPGAAQRPVPAPDAPGEEPTVSDHRLYDQPESPEEGVEIVDGNAQPGSGTKTALHSAKASPGEADLENQKTVISRRPDPLPPHLTSPKDLGGLLEGEQLGHFRLDEFVGGGGMGAVFRGTDLQLGRTVAVKVLSRDQGADDETLRRFKNEAQSAARLDHDNIARVFFVGEHEGWNFIVFEFIEGVNLRDLVEQNGPLPLETAVDYVVQVAEALEHAAARDVVHRDIKPSNVLIAPDGHAKLVDMGLARLHHMEAGHSDLTASGVTLGTFDYISPEQASDPRRADVRSDLYSLGCTLYFMLVGRPPFPHGTVLQKLLAHSGESPPDPRDERPDLPPELSKIILRLLAKRPEQRYQDPHEFIREMLILRDRLGFGESHALLADGRHIAPTWGERLVTYGLPAALLLAVLFGFDAYWNGSASNTSLPGFDVPRPAGNPQSPGEQPPPQSPDPDAVPSGGERNEGATAGAVELPGGAKSTVNETTDASSANAVRSDSGSESNAAPGNGSGNQSSPVNDAPPVRPIATANGDTNAPVILRQFVIGDAAEIGDPGGESRIFPTLSQALASDDFAANVEHLEVIEFRGPQRLEKSSVTIDLPGDKQLVLRGVSDGATPPEIVFPVRAATSPAGDWGAIQFKSGKLIVENLHLRVAVGEDLSPAHDVALVRFSTDKKKQLELSRCILTIENPTPELSETVACFDVVAEASALVGESQQKRLPLHLRDCIIRGQATMLRMRQSLPVQFKWSNGLLATSERLLLAEGAPRETDETTMTISLLNVTADVGRGLCLLRDSDRQPYQPALELVCNRTIISAGDSNLVEHDGVNDFEFYKRSLFIGGPYNAYEDVATFWHISATDAAGPGYDWAAWDERLRMESMPSSLNSIGWLKLRSEVADVPVHERRVDDYLLDAEDPGAADTGFLSDDAETTLKGFTHETLPALPRPAEAETALPVAPAEST